ncbi:MAG: DUF2252 family protein [Candidatus Korobacteraceae bacterium]
MTIGEHSRSHGSVAPQFRYGGRLDNSDSSRLASERGRVENLPPIKHQRMSLSPFSFYRGAVPLMAADLSLLPSTGLIAQLCGDAHVHNLGSYTAPDGRIIFDLNDFDETIPGPFEWDVKRMATSLVLGGRRTKRSSCAKRKCRRVKLG